MGTISSRWLACSLAGKVANGVSADEIIKKELSLAGVQVPVKESPDWQQIFKFGDFSGWVIEKR